LTNPSNEPARQASKMSASPSETIAMNAGSDMNAGLDLNPGKDLMPGRDLRWYAATTLPRQEMVAAENLKAQSFEFLLPRLRVTKRHARKVVQAIDPLFPGYIFVRMDPAVTAWRSINGTRGIGHLVMSGDRPVPARPGVVETIIESIGPDGTVKFIDPIQPGAHVRLVSGPFADVLGEVISLDGRGRVNLMLSLFGMFVYAETKRGNLVAA
jgi:transcription antitermination factor NusG